MGYLMRHLTTDPRPITLAEIEAALKAVDPRYAIINTEVPDIGDLMFDSHPCGVIEINRPGDDIFEDDLMELRDLVGEGSEAQQRVRAVLDQTQTMIVVEAEWQGQDAEPVLSRLDPLWDWLAATYGGLLNADNEGFYAGDDLILERRFTL